MQHPANMQGVGGARVSLKSVVRARHEGVYKFPSIAIGPRMGVYSNTLQNARVALNRRVLFAYDKHTDTYEQRAVATAEAVKQLSIFSQHLRKLTTSTVRCGLEDYPKLYTGGKRKVYERAVKSLLTNPLTDWDAVVTGFIKLEASKLAADPRLIQTRSPRFHAMLGCYLRPLEKEVYRGIDRLFGERTVTKGLNGREIGQLIADKFSRCVDPVAIGLDASRFDRSVSMPILEWMHSIYTDALGKNNPELDRLLAYQRHNVGKIYARGGSISYKVEAGVMSGDIDTSLKGCTIMCGMVWTWLNKVGVKGHVINNGDDCVVVCERSELSRFLDGLEDHFKDLGFVIVAEKPVYEIEHVEFCQARPVLASDNTYIMCRNPVVATVKDSMCRIDVRRTKDAMNWLSAVASCGKALAGDMPVFASFYNMYDRAAPVKTRSWVVQHGQFASGLLWLSKGLEFRTGVTDATRLSFWRAWGIAPHEQRAIENYYDEHKLVVGYEGPIENFPPESFRAPVSLQVLANGS